MQGISENRMKGKGGRPISIFVVQLVYLTALYFELLLILAYRKNLLKGM